MSGRFVDSIMSRVAAVPQKVRWAFWATVTWAGFTILSALGLVGSRSFVKAELVKSNDKSNNPTRPYTDAMIEHDASRVIVSGVVTSVLSALILVLFAFMLLRGRSLARWGLVGLASLIPLLIPFGVGVLPQLVYGVTVGGAPLYYRIPLVAAGLAALAVFVLLLLPETAQFFAANRPVRPEGAARPSLFGRRLAAPPPPRPVANDVVADDVIVVAEAQAAARTVKRRGTATRPGSVKPKAADRSGRSKSRNQ